MPLGPIELATSDFYPERLGGKRSMERQAGNDGRRQPILLDRESGIAIRQQLLYLRISRSLLQRLCNLWPIGAKVSPHAITRGL